MYYNMNFEDISKTEEIIEKQTHQIQKINILGMIRVLKFQEIFFPITRDGITFWPG